MELACAKRVYAALKKWSDKIKDDKSPAAPGDLERIQAAGADAVRCLADPLAAQAMADLIGIRDETCACEDEACVVTQQEALEAWGAEYPGLQPTDTYPAEAFTEVAQNIGQCAAAAMQP
jgi:hypothetical protein